jgi:hypothetical protein
MELMITKKCRQIDDDIDPHAAGAIQQNVHFLMERIRGFTRSHLMPPLGK